MLNVPPDALTIAVLAVSVLFLSELFRVQFPLAYISIAVAVTS
jgi:hypothetical protein